VRIDQEKCIACRRCNYYCTMNAIHLEEIPHLPGKVSSVVDEEECVECGACKRADVCPVDAIYEQTTTWPRTVRSNFSNPLVEHKETKIPGRGTEEMKTNDVTGRFKRGYAGISVEMGRPGTGARLSDLEKVAMAIAKVGVDFESKNPLTGLMVDKKRGKLSEEVLQEKVLSAIIEFVTPLEKVRLVLKAIKEASKKIETVFSLDLVCLPDEEGHIPTLPMAKQEGFIYRINGKTNLGLGRPKALEVE
jgi:ferredoxin